MEVISYDFHFVGQRTWIGGNLDFTQGKVKSIFLENIRLGVYLNPASRVILQIQALFIFFLEKTVPLCRIFCN